MFINIAIELGILDSADCLNDARVLLSFFVIVSYVPTLCNVFYRIHPDEDELTDNFRLLHIAVCGW